MEKSNVVIVPVSGDEVAQLVIKAKGLNYKEGSKKTGTYCIIGYKGVNFTLDDNHPFVEDLRNQTVMTATVEQFTDEDGKTRLDYAGHITFDGAARRADAEAKVAKSRMVLRAIETATLSPESVNAILATSAGF